MRSVSNHLLLTNCPAFPQPIKERVTPKLDTQTNNSMVKLLVLLNTGKTFGDESRVKVDIGLLEVLHISTARVV